MKAMWNIYRIFAVTAVIIAASACAEEYNELPPKTDATIQYALPVPEKPDQTEIARVNQLRAEYENSTK